MIARAAMLLGILACASVASAGAPASSAEVLQHHFSSINKGDLDAILGDYAEDAFMITGRGVIKGRDAIRTVYARMTKEGTAGVEMKLVASFSEGEVAHAVWTQDGGAQKTAATLVVKGGKIVSQVIVQGLKPDNQ